MSLASRATSVPAIPMARPTSAFLSAGASFVPSPVTATTAPVFWRACTRRSLSRGSARAITSRPCAAVTWSSGESVRNSFPVTTFPPARIPASCAMARAVSGLSPVTIRTRMPAPRLRATDSGMFSRSGSRMPTYPSQERPVSLSSVPVISRWANARVRMARAAYVSTPVRSGCAVQRPARISGAPLTSRNFLPLISTTVDILFRFPSNRNCLRGGNCILISRYPIA